jgi:hypothetical protein
MAHIDSGVIALSQSPNPRRFQKTLGINDYYWDAPDSELPLGHIQMLGKSDRNILRAGAPWFAPRIRARLHGQAAGVGRPGRPRRSRRSLGTGDEWLVGRGYLSAESISLVLAGPGDHTDREIKEEVPALQAA